MVVSFSTIARAVLVTLTIELVDLSPAWLMVVPGCLQVEIVEANISGWRLEFLARTQQGNRH